jgi:hypothetical protein
VTAGGGFLKDLARLTVRRGQSKNADKVFSYFVDIAGAFSNNRFIFE